MLTANWAFTNPKRVDILGVQVSAIDMGMALETVETWIDSGTSNYICVTGVHGVMESQRDAGLLEIHNRAGLVTPDGMPLVWLSRMRGLKYVQRVCGADLLLACAERAASRGWGFYLYGGAPGVAELLSRRLCARFPGLRVVGCYSPPFRLLTPKEDQELIDRINDAAPDVVWVGLSTPKQERWMYAHVQRLNSAVLVGVGAAFDFHAGLKRRAPTWMQRSGMEWAFRLLTEPRRLWLRYLTNNPEFVWRVGLRALGLRSGREQDASVTSD